MPPPPIDDDDANHDDDDDDDDDADDDYDDNDDDNDDEDDDADDADDDDDDDGDEDHDDDDDDEKTREGTLARLLPRPPRSRLEANIFVREVGRDLGVAAPLRVLELAFALAPLLYPGVGCSPAHLGSNGRHVDP